MGLKAGGASRRAASRWRDAGGRVEKVEPRKAKS